MIAIWHLGMDLAKQLSDVLSRGYADLPAWFLLNDEVADGRRETLPREAACGKIFSN